MYKLCLLRLYVLLNFFQVTLAAANNTYADCLAVASQFSTTINGPVPNITQTVGINVTCTSLTGSSCPGTSIQGVCTWQRKLSVTCINSLPVRIRIQSNGLPGRCASMSSSNHFDEINIDFEVNFNPDVNINSPNYSPSTTTDLNAILCNATSLQTVPSTSNYTSYSSIMTSRIVGVAIDNVIIYKANNLNDVDPLYPSGGNSAESIDTCLCRMQTGSIYRYYMASGCIVSPPTGNINMCSSVGACSADVANYSINSFPPSARNLTILGIAKDGHVIYGPFTSTGTEITSGFDICNGMFYDSVGNYGYFSTRKFPYMVGCFGPGNYPPLTPQCTTNAHSFYNMSSYALTFITSTLSTTTVTTPTRTTTTRTTTTTTATTTTRTTTTTTATITTRTTTTTTVTTAPRTTTTITATTTTTTATIATTTSISQNVCNNNSLIQLSNGTCVSTIVAQITTVATLRSNITNSTVLVSTLIDYFIATSDQTGMTPNNSLTVMEIENLIDQIDGNFNLSSPYTIIMAEKFNESNNIIGASFISHIGGGLVTNATRLQVLNTSFSSAAIITPELLMDIIQLTVLIMDTPNEYRRLNRLQNKSIASSVIIVSAKRFPNPYSFNRMNISLYFQVNSAFKPHRPAIYFCSFLNLTTMSWSESGCTNPPSYNKIFDRYECSCNHLTSFALMWSPYSSTINGTDATTRPSLDGEDISSIIFQSISIICFIAIVIHGSFIRLSNPKLSPTARDLLPLISCSSTMLLFLFYMALGLTVYYGTESSNETTCSTTSTILMFTVYFLLIFMMCTKTSVGYFNYRRFTQLFTRPTHRLFILLMSISLTVSTFMISFAVGFNSNSSYNLTQLYPYKTCWFSRHVIYYFLILPISVFLIISIVFFILIAHKLWNHARKAPSQNLVNTRLKKMVFILLSSSISQGLAWILGPFLVIFTSSSGNALAWIFNILNGLEGVWSIVLYVIIRQQHEEKTKQTTVPQALPVEDVPDQIPECSPQDVNIVFRKIR